MINYVPLNDEKKHLLSQKCPCDPSVYVRDDGREVIAHNPYDLRIILEEMALDHGKKYILLDSNEINYNENQEI